MSTITENGRILDLLVTTFEFHVIISHIQFNMLSMVDVISFLLYAKFQLLRFKNKGINLGMKNTSPKTFSPNWVKVDVVQEGIKMLESF